MSNSTRGPAARRAPKLALPAAVLAALIIPGGIAGAASEPTDEADATSADKSATQQKASTSAKRRTRMRTTDTSPRRLFLDSGRKARFEFELAGDQKRDLVVKAFRVRDNLKERRWRLDDVEPGTTQTIKWNGKRGNGKWASQGKHTFRVYERGRGKADMADAKGKKRFRFYKHRFPIRARHTYGDGFGAGRGHQGVDIFSRCGKSIRAVRGGRVQVRGSHSSAGKYLVIDGRGTKKDYVYMHLQRRDRPKQGERVRTGEKIGRVGATGNASGCHLHFELWSKPGWYEGGRAVPATKRMKRWDSYS